MKENVSGCFFSEHSVDSLLWGRTVGYPSDSLAPCYFGLHPFNSIYSYLGCTRQLFCEH